MGAFIVAEDARVDQGEARHFFTAPATLDLDLPLALFPLPGRDDELARFGAPPGLQRELQRASSRHEYGKSAAQGRKTIEKLTGELFPKKNQLETDETYWGRALTEWKANLAESFSQETCQAPEQLSTEIAAKQKKMIQLLKVGETLRIVNRAVERVPSGNLWDKFLGKLGAKMVKKELGGIMEWFTPFLNLAHEHFVGQDSLNVLRLSDIHLTPQARFYKNEILKPVYDLPKEGPYADQFRRILQITGTSVLALAPLVAAIDLTQPNSPGKLLFEIFVRVACLGAGTTLALKLETLRQMEKLEQG